MTLLRSRTPFLLAPLVLLALGLIASACGGDDDDEIRTGSVEDYVKAACEAQSAFLEDFFAAAFSLDEDASPKEQADALKGPLKDLVDAMKDARPPEDLVDYHRSVVASAEAMLKAAEDGDLDALDSADLSGEDLSQADADRLNAIAADMEECEGNDTPFGG